MIEKDLKVLSKEFNKIKKLEYIKGINKGNTSVSSTFDNLLTKNNEISDLITSNSIAIKVKRSYSKAYITLFDMVPTNDKEELKRLSINYGINELNTLKGEISTIKYTKVNRNYYFILRVDYKKEKIFLEIYDIYKNMLEDNIYWDFKTLKNKTLEKLSVLALVKDWPDRIGGLEYFKYYKMNIYLLKNIDYFINSIAEGNIKISMRISYNGKKLLSHKVSFIIKEEDLLTIYDLYR